MNDETYLHYRRGQASAPFILALPIVFVYPIVLLGAVRMKRARDYGLAVMSAVFALFPCSLVCVISIPVGIWALCVLSNPDVKAAFSSRNG